MPATTPRFIHPRFARHALAAALLTTLAATSADAAAFLRVDRCSTQVGSTFKPTLSASYRGQNYTFEFGKDGLTNGVGFTSRRALAWVKARIGAPEANGRYTVCGQEDPRQDFNRDDR